MRRQTRIIRVLDKHWNLKNVFFGRIIHDLNPKTKLDWINFLKTQNFYFIKGLKEMGFKYYERKQWVWYITNSFWKLYLSESKAIEYFKELGINLKFTSQNLDSRHGFDFYWEVDSDKYYLIVKHGILDLQSLTKYKSLSGYENVFLFDSADKCTYKYDAISKSFVLIPGVVCNPAQTI